MSRLDRLQYRYHTMVLGMLPLHLVLRQMFHGGINPSVFRVLQLHPLQQLFFQVHSLGDFGFHQNLFAECCLRFSNRLFLVVLWRFSDRTHPHVSADRGDLAHGGLGWPCAVMPQQCHAGCSSFSYTEPIFQVLVRPPVLQDQQEPLQQETYDPAQSAWPLIRQVDSS